MEPTQSESLAHCPICAHTTILDSGLSPRDPFTKELFKLTDCRNCGFRFTNPRPIVSEIGKYYLSTEYISHTNSSSSVADRFYKLARILALWRKTDLLRKYHSSGRVLDVGCGTGEFLSCAGKAGFHVHGIEPGPQARAQAILLHGLHVDVELSALNASETFDAITLWHVLEHFHDPSDALKNIVGYLKPGGHIFIAVPDRNSWDSAYYRSDWAAWDVPRHLSHFRLSDILYLADKQGLAVASVRRMWFDAPYISMLSERSRGRNQISALIMGGLIGGFSNLVALFSSSRPTSSTLYILRRR